MEKNSNIRRIDELGRIVIPKDIRKKLMIKENEPLEIFINNEAINIKKYSTLPNIMSFVDNILDASSRITHHEFIIFNEEKILCSSVKEYLNKKIKYKENVNKIICDDVVNEYKDFEITDDIRITGYTNSCKIVADSDFIGIILEYSDSPFSNELIKILANIIEFQVTNS